MKALTICQPYAELIVAGEKRVENRRWGTSFRGEFLIHAGKSRAWLDSYEPLPASMEFGAIVGVARLTDCLPLARIRAAFPLPSRLSWLRDHAHVEGPWCFVLADVRRLQWPIPFRGAQGFFEIDEADLAAGLF